MNWKGRSSSMGAAPSPSNAADPPPAAPGSPWPDVRRFSPTASGNALMPSFSLLPEAPPAARGVSGVTCTAKQWLGT